VGGWINAPHSRFHATFFNNFTEGRNKFSHNRRHLTAEIVNSCDGLVRVVAISNTRTALTMQAWCSTRSREKAISGLAASG
jgi:phosphoketolase